jgi:UDP-glucose 4-epimerase
MLRRFGYIDFTSEQIEFLKYGRAIDTSRAKQRLGFSPTYTTRQTFDAFLRAHPLGRVLPWDVSTEPDEATVTTIGGQAR